VKDEFKPQYCQKKKENEFVWWPNPVISALRRLRQEDSKFKVSLSYTEQEHLKKKNKKNPTNQTEKTTLQQLKEEGSYTDRVFFKIHQGKTTYLLKNTVRVTYKTL
jgi:hypothetical protein